MHSKTMTQRVVTAALLLGAMASGHASTRSSSTLVSATVVRTCSVRAQALAFGRYTPAAGAVNATSTLSVGCTRGTAFEVSISAGKGPGATVASRAMVNASGALAYNLYSSAAHTSIVGDGTHGTVRLTGAGTGVASPRRLTVYGVLPDSAANKVARPGAYSDTLTVSVFY